jgi:hypothetical protein
MPINNNLGLGFTRRRLYSSPCTFLLYVPQTNSFHLPLRATHGEACCAPDGPFPLL